ncbi:unnamed protein product [Parnassius mnemosyne]|uniref:Uncharacterized protein n=1 Tax=Parnassius mnemosyne TaxID=213953 RepID=A0AAV1KVA2_9NEOP
MFCHDWTIHWIKTQQILVRTTNKFSDSGCFIIIITALHMSTAEHRPPPRNATKHGPEPPASIDFLHVLVSCHTRSSEIRSRGSETALLLSTCRKPSSRACLYWDRANITDRTILANKPDIVMTDRAQSRIFLIDITIP